MTGVPESTDVTLVLPCLDEAAGLPWILSRLPEHVRAIVADNGSTDGSVEADQVFGRQEWLGEFDGTEFADKVTAMITDRSSPGVPGGDPDPDRAHTRGPGMPALGPRFSRGGSAVRPR